MTPADIKALVRAIDAYLDGEAMVVPNPEALAKEIAASGNAKLAALVECMDRCQLAEFVE